jgi:50S ribosomal subunit-associated GTPase HflX
MSEPFSTDNTAIERAILVGVMVRGRNEECDVRDTLDELAQLTEGAGAEVLDRVLERRSRKTEPVKGG